MPVRTHKPIWPLYFWLAVFVAGALACLAAGAYSAYRGETGWAIAMIVAAVINGIAAGVLIADIEHRRRLRSRS